MFYVLGNVIIRILLRAFSRYEIVGLENVPQSGPLIVIANHISWLDPPMLGAILPRPIRFMAKEELFRIPVVAWVVKAYHAFPVRRGEGDRQALRTAVEILKCGEVLGIFPEGTRSKSAKLQQGHSGAAVIALKAGAPILPIGIAGTQIVCRFPNVLTRPKFTVNIGRPFRVTQKEIGKENLAEVRTELMRHIAELLPEEYRGVYARNEAPQNVARGLFPQSGREIIH